MLKSFLKTINSWFSKDMVEEYNFKGMNLKCGRGSTFWTPEKESKMLELFGKNYSYAEVGRAIGATNGQLASKVRSLRKKGIMINGTNKVKSSPVSKSTNKKNKTKAEKKQSVKSMVSEAINNLK